MKRRFYEVFFGLLLSVNRSFRRFYEVFFGLLLSVNRSFRRFYEVFFGLLLSVNRSFCVFSVVFAGLLASSKPAYVGLMKFSFVLRPSRRPSCEWVQVVDFPSLATR